MGCVGGLLDRRRVHSLLEGVATGTAWVSLKSYKPRENFDPGRMKKNHRGFIEKPHRCPCVWAFQPFPIFSYSTHTYISVKKKKKRKEENYIFIHQLFCCCSFLYTTLAQLTGGRDLKKFPTLSKFELRFELVSNKSFLSLIRIFGLLTSSLLLDSKHFG